jgi:hypothetical protein
MFEFDFFCIKLEFDNFFGSDVDVAMSRTFDRSQLKMFFFFAYHVLSCDMLTLGLETVS